METGLEMVLVKAGGFVFIKRIRRWMMVDDHFNVFFCIYTVGLQTVGVLFSEIQSLQL